MSSGSETRIPITARALVQRFKRHYAAQGLTFHTVRRGPLPAILGRHYVTSSTGVARSWPSWDAVVATARELGIIRPYEDVPSGFGWSCSTQLNPNE